jgi:hypothetical protein
MIWLYWYVSIALLSMATDSAISYVAKRRHRLVLSMLGGLTWPVSLPLCIAFSWHATRRYREW